MSSTKCHCSLASSHSELHTGPNQPNPPSTTDIRNNIPLLERAVSHFDARYTLRALRSIPSIRKKLSPRVLVRVIALTYPGLDETAKTLIRATGATDDIVQSVLLQIERENATAQSAPSTTTTATSSKSSKPVIAEADIFISIIIQVWPCRCVLRESLLS